MSALGSTHYPAGASAISRREGWREARRDGWRETRRDGWREARRDAMPYEGGLPIFVARRPRVDLQTAWPRLRFLE